MSDPLSQRRTKTLNKDLQIVGLPPFSPQTLGIQAGIVVGPPPSLFLGSAAFRPSRTFRVEFRASSPTANSRIPTFSSPDSASHRIVNPLIVKPYFFECCDSPSSEPSTPLFCYFATPAGPRYPDGLRPFHPISPLF